MSHGEEKTERSAAFGLAVRIETRTSGKESREYGVKVHITGVQWFGKALRTAGAIGAAATLLRLAF